MNINEQINREIGVHGQKWNEMHEGYFSSSVIAHPLVATITKYLLGSHTDLLVDLGGGTGFILLELIAVLRHIRNQARENEIFIHQTACFENAEDARCINFLYREMRTQKWYPTISELHDSMAINDWQMIDTCPAPPLNLTSEVMGQRYGLDLQSLEKICGRVKGQFGEMENVFQLTPDGFVAYLHYRICVSKAI